LLLSTFFFFLFSRSGTFFVPMDSGVDTDPSLRFQAVNRASREVYESCLFLANYAFGPLIKHPVSSSSFPGSQVVTLSPALIRQHMQGRPLQHAAYDYEKEIKPWIDNARSVQIPTVHYAYFSTERSTLLAKADTSETLDFGSHQDKLFHTRTPQYLHVDSLDFGSRSPGLYLGAMHRSSEYNLPPALPVYSIALATEDGTAEDTRRT
jgi:hypothetical protein